MPRFKDRQLQLMDMVDRFEAVPSSTHTRYALGVIGRLMDDGADFGGIQGNCIGGKIIA